MIDEYKIIIASDFEHEKVFAEIYKNGKFIALVSQENGIDNLEIEFPDNSVDQSLILRKINYDSFFNALIHSKLILKGKDK